MSTTEPISPKPNHRILKDELIPKIKVLKVIHDSSGESTSAQVGMSEDLGREELGGSEGEEEEEGHQMVSQTSILSPPSSLNHPQDSPQTPSPSRSFNESLTSNGGDGDGVGGGESDFVPQHVQNDVAQFLLAVSSGQGGGGGFVGKSLNGSMTSSQDSRESLVSSRDEESNYFHSLQYARYKLLNSPNHHHRDTADMTLLQFDSPSPPPRPPPPQVGNVHLTPLPHSHGHGLLPKLVKGSLLHYTTIPPSPPSPPHVPIAPLGLSPKATWSSEKLQTSPSMAHLSPALQHRGSPNASAETIPSPALGRMRLDVRILNRSRGNESLEHDEGLDQVRAEDADAINESSGRLTSHYDSTHTASGGPNTLIAPQEPNLDPSPSADQAVTHTMPPQTSPLYSFATPQLQSRPGPEIQRPLPETSSPNSPHPDLGSPPVAGALRLDGTTTTSPSEPINIGIGEGHTSSPIGITPTGNVTTFVPPPTKHGPKVTKMQHALSPRSLSMTVKNLARRPSHHTVAATAATGVSPGSSIGSPMQPAGQNISPQGFAPSSSIRSHSTHTPNSQSPQNPPTGSIHSSRPSPPTTTTATLPFTLRRRQHDPMISGPVLVSTTNSMRVVPIRTLMESARVQTQTEAQQVPGPTQAQHQSQPHEDILNSVLPRQPVQEQSANTSNIAPTQTLKDPITLSRNQSTISRSQAFQELPQPTPEDTEALQRLLSKRVVNVESWDENERHLTRTLQRPPPSQTSTSNKTSPISQTPEPLNPVKPWSSPDDALRPFAPRDTLGELGDNACHVQEMTLKFAARAPMPEGGTMRRAASHAGNLRRNVTITGGMVSVVNSSSPPPATPAKRAGGEGLKGQASFGHLPRVVYPTLPTQGTDEEKLPEIPSLPQQFRDTSLISRSQTLGRDSRNRGLVLNTSQLSNQSPPPPIPQIQPQYSHHTLSISHSKSLRRKPPSETSDGSKVSSPTQHSHTDSPVEYFFSSQSGVPDFTGGKKVGSPHGSTVAQGKGDLSIQPSQHMQSQIQPAHQGSTTSPASPLMASPNEKSPVSPPAKSKKSFGIQKVKQFVGKFGRSKHSAQQNPNPMGKYMQQVQPPQPAATFSHPPPIQPAGYANGTHGSGRSGTGSVSGSSSCERYRMPTFNVDAASAGGSLGASATISSHSSPYRVSPHSAFQSMQPASATASPTIAYPSGFTHKSGDSNVVSEVVPNDQDIALYHLERNMETTIKTEQAVMERIRKEDEERRFERKIKAGTIMKAIDEVSHQSSAEESEPMHEQVESEPSMEHPDDDIRRPTKDTELDLHTSKSLSNIAQTSDSSDKVHSMLMDSFMISPRASLFNASRITTATTSPDTSSLHHIPPVASLPQNRQTGTGRVRTRTSLSLENTLVPPVPAVRVTRMRSGSCPKRISIAAEKFDGRDSTESNESVRTMVNDLDSQIMERGKVIRKASRPTPPKRRGPSLMPKPASASTSPQSQSSDSLFISHPPRGARSPKSPIQNMVMRSPPGKTAKSGLDVPITSEADHVMFDNMLRTRNFLANARRGSESTPQQVAR